MTRIDGGDVEWLRAHPADDFICIESDGSVQFRDGFLGAAALGPDLGKYRLDHVDARFHGEAALVRASGSGSTRRTFPASVATPMFMCRTAWHGNWFPRRSRGPRHRLETCRASRRGIAAGIRVRS